MFKEHETCDSPGNCKSMERCMSALAIKLVTSKVEQKIIDNPSSLQIVVSETGCRHSQAKKASKSAKNLLAK